FDELKGVPSPEVLAHRVVWSVAFLAVVLPLAGRRGEVGRCLRDRALLRRLLAPTVLIAVNWLTFIYSVASGPGRPSRLGYFIAPLVSVLLGLVVLGERLRPAQGLAVLLALAGVLNLVVVGGGLPWIALTLAASFGLYGLLRKQAQVDALVGLAVETALLLPAAAADLVSRVLAGRGGFRGPIPGVPVHARPAGVAAVA